MTRVKNATTSLVDVEANGQILAPCEVSDDIKLTERDRGLVASGHLLALPKKRGRKAVDPNGDES